MSFLGQLTSTFTTDKTENEFWIYTNDVLDPAADEITLEASKAIKFNTLYDLAYKSQVNIAWEPLENSQFSSDSLQDTPDTIFLTGIVSPFSRSRDYTNEDYRAELERTVDQLKEYERNLTLLTIIRERPLFQFYTDLKIVSFSYSLDPNHNNLRAYVGFQQIRITDSTQFGSLAQAQVADPANASQVNNGLQSAQPPKRESDITVELVGENNG